MKLNLQTAVEYVDPNGSVAPNPPPASTQPVLSVPGMEPHDWWVLSLVLRGQSIPQISSITGIGIPKLAILTKRPIFLEQLDIQSRVMIENITNGNYGVSQIARANAPDAMRRIIDHSRQSRDLKVSLMASKEVLNYAGLQPVRRIETLSVDALLPKMTPEELIHFAKTLELPDRFAEQAQRLKALPSPTEEARFATARRIDPDDPVVEGVQNG